MFCLGAENAKNIGVVLCYFTILICCFFDIQLALLCHKQATERLYKFYFSV